MIVRGCSNLGLVGFVAGICAPVAVVSAEPVGTAFTFQGQLKKDGAPVGSLMEVTCDFDVGLWTAEDASGTELGSQVVQATVKNGLFMLKLNEAGQFTADAFNGDRRWLEISVCCTPNDCTNPPLNFAPLGRQEISPTPYALRAKEAGDGVGSVWQLNGSDVYYNDGNVGIGATNPLVPLAIRRPGSSNQIGITQEQVGGGSTMELTTADGADDDGDGAPEQATRLLLRGGSDDSDVEFYRGGRGSEQISMFIEGTNGNVGIGTTNPQQDLHIVDEDHRSVLALDTYFSDPGGSIIRARKARGTEGAPTAVAADDILFDLRIGGHDGTPADSTGFDDVSSAIRSFATENWADGAHGADLRFATTKNGRTVAVERMRIKHNGSVGIGTDDPNAALHIDTDTLFDLSSTPTGQDNLLLTDISAGAGQHHVMASIGFGNGPTSRRAAIAAIQTGTGLHHQGLAFYTHPSGTGSDDLEEQMRIKHNGNVGIGTNNPGAKLHIRGDLAETTAIRISVDNNDQVELGASVFGSYLTLNEPSGSSAITLSGYDGRVKAKLVEITGADVAEKFPVSDRVEPGMVVEIDPDNAGKLRRAREAYSRRVAGVVSGAGGLSVGAVLGNLPGHEGAPPIALSGRVWVHCDTSNGPIEPGDLLTTSDTRGHAMKVTDYAAAHGAILGKAMTSLETGNGLVLVLVSLQ